MDASTGLTLTTVLNPFDPQTTREVRCVPHGAGTTVAEYLRAAGVAPSSGLDLAVSWNGRVLTDAECRRMVPRIGDCITVCARPHGGGGGKNVVKMIAMIAIMVVSVVTVQPWLAGAAAGWGLSAGAAAAVGWAGVAGVNIAGAMLVNAVMPGPKVSTSANNWGESSPTYAWGTTANLMREGIALPVVFGTMLCTPPVIAAHVRVGTDGSEYLNILYALGEGQLSIMLDSDYSDQAAVYINGQHYSQFARSVTVEPQKAKLPGTASASSYRHGTGPFAVNYVPARAIDGSVDGIPWIKATSDSSPWWQIDLGSTGAAAVTAYRIATHPSGIAESWTLKGSNNGSTWTGLDTRTSVTIPTLTRYTFANTTKYRYYRIDGAGCISDVEFYTADAGLAVTTVGVKVRGGSNTQGVIPEFARTYSMEGSWSAAKITTDYTERELTGSSITGIVVGVSFPYGLYAVDSSGNKVNDDVQFTLQWCTYSGGWGAWQDWGTYIVRACSVGAYKWTRELSGLTAGQYKVRVKFASAPHSGTRYVNTAYWEYCETAIDDELTYPNTALLGLCVLATDQLSGGMPRVTALVSRPYVSVDVSGTPTDCDAGNPAWAAYDILANARYGAGVDTDDIIYAEFAAWAAFCDDPENLDAWAGSTAYSVGDRVLPTAGNEGYSYKCTVAGTTGTGEPTWPTTDGDTVTDGGVTWEAEEYGHRLNVAFDNATSVAGALTDIAVAGHGVVVQRGCQYGVIIDQAASPTQMFGMGNIVKDSFRINYMDLNERANCVEVTYWDKDRDYSRTVVEVRASGFDAGTDTERNAPAVTLYGCTSRRAAVKYGRYLLRQNALIGHVITFDAGVDAIAVLPGDVFKFSHDVPMWQYSGRITAVDPDDGEDVTEITLDQAIYCETTKSYQIQVRESNSSDAMVTIALDAVLVNGSYDTFTCSAATGIILPGDVYIFGETTDETKLYRVMSISRSQDQARQITAAVYDPDLYVDVEGLPVPEEATAVVGVKNLRAAEVTREGVLMASLAWDGRATDWNVTTELYVAGAWVFDSVTNTRQQTWVEIPVTKGVPHRFTVRSVWPAASDTYELRPLGTREWDFDLFFDVTFSDNKPDLSHVVSFGWRDKDHRDFSDCFVYGGRPTYVRPAGSPVGEVCCVVLTGRESLSPDISSGNFWLTSQTYGGKHVWLLTLGEDLYYCWYRTSDTRWVISTALGSIPDGVGWLRIKRADDEPFDPELDFRPEDGASGKFYLMEGATSSGYLHSEMFPGHSPYYRWAVELREIGYSGPFYFKLHPGTGHATATLRWDQTSIPAMYPMYLQECDSSFVPTGSDIDMSAQSSLSLSISDSTYYRIHLAKATETQEITLKPGWNLVATSLYPTTPDPAVVFDDADIDEVQEWDPATAAFVDAVVILPKVGYWVHNNGASDVEITVTGWRPPEWISRYLQGPADGASEHTREAIGFCEAMTPTFPACTKAYLQQFNATTGTYETVTGAVAEGVGYWIDVTADGQILVNDRE